MRLPTPPIPPFPPVPGDLPRPPLLGCQPGEPARLSLMEQNISPAGRALQEPEAARPGGHKGEARAARARESGRAVSGNLRANSCQGWSPISSLAPQPLIKLKWK